VQTTLAIRFDDDDGGVVVVVIDTILPRCAIKAMWNLNQISFDFRWCTPHASIKKKKIASRTAQGQPIIGAEYVLHTYPHIYIYIYIYVCIYYRCACSIVVSCRFNIVAKFRFHPYKGARWRGRSEGGGGVYEGISPTSLFVHAYKRVV